jgi:hypothetical protein
MQQHFQNKTAFLVSLVGASMVLLVAAILALFVGATCLFFGAIAAIVVWRHAPDGYSFVQGLLSDEEAFDEQQGEDDEEADDLPVIAAPSHSRAMVLRETDEDDALSEIYDDMPSGRELLQSGLIARMLADGKIILGCGENGRLKWISRKKVFSTLVSGLPSVGKSTTVFWIVLQIIIDGGRIWIADPHMHFEDEDGNRSLAAEMSALADESRRLGLPNPFVFPPCDDTPKEVVKRVRWMYSQLKQRKRVGYLVRAADTILAIMDEFNTIAGAIDPKMEIADGLNFAQMIALLEREGRKYGLHFMLIGHRWAQQDIGGESAVRTNATTYLCHRLNDERQANLLLGQGQGKRMLSLSPGSYWLAGPVLPDESILKITTPMISARDIPLILAVKQAYQGSGTSHFRGSSGAVPGQFPTGSQPVPDLTGTSREPLPSHFRAVPDGNYPIMRQFAHPTASLEPAAESDLDNEKLSRMRAMVKARAPQNEIIADLFPGMRNSAAIALYRLYLAALVGGE